MFIFQKSTLFWKYKPSVKATLKSSYNVYNLSILIHHCFDEQLILEPSAF